MLEVSCVREQRGCGSWRASSLARGGDLAVGRPDRLGAGPRGFHGRTAGPVRWARPGLKAGAEIPPEKIQELYRKILADWSAGQTDRAPDELIELETAVVLDTDARTRKTLLKEEQAVIHQVGAADLEVLVPIAVLHHEAYRRLLERGSRGHALAMVHTRNMAKDLALLYSEQSGSEGAKLVASRLLTSLGGLLLQSAQQLPAAEMFQKADRAGRPQHRRPAGARDGLREERAGRDRRQAPAPDPRDRARQRRGPAPPGAQPQAAGPGRRGPQAARGADGGQGALLGDPARLPGARPAGRRPQEGSRRGGEGAAAGHRALPGRSAAAHPARRGARPPRRAGRGDRADREGARHARSPRGRRLPLPLQRGP